MSAVPACRLKGGASICQFARNLGSRSGQVVRGHCFQQPQGRPRRPSLRAVTASQYYLETVYGNGQGGGKDALGVVIVAETSDGLEQIGNLYRQVTKRQNVGVAHMDDAESSITQAIRGCVQRGASRVVVVPYFLSASQHRVQQQLPFAVAAAQLHFPRVRCVTAEGIGIDSVLVGLIEGRVKVLEPSKVEDVSERGWAGLPADAGAAGRSQVGGGRSAASLPGAGAASGQQQQQRRVSDWMSGQSAKASPQPDRAWATPERRRASPAPERAWARPSSSPQRLRTAPERGWASSSNPERGWESSNPERGWAATSNPERGWASGAQPAQSAERGWQAPQPAAASPERGWASSSNPERGWDNPERGWAAGGQRGDSAERGWEAPRPAEDDGDKEVKRQYWKRMLG